MVEDERTVQVPEALGLPVIGVPPGDDLHLAVRAEAVEEGVLVTISVAARAVGECVRCLDPVGEDLSLTARELYYYTDRTVDSDDEDEVLRIHDDQVDVESVVRDVIVTALPLAPLCRPDCPGLCPQCGIRLDDDPEHRHEVVDDRWAALRGLDLPAD
jgi:uncharacterized protein